MSEFGNTPPFFIAGRPVTATNTVTTSFTGGAWTFTKTAEASAAETLMTWKVSDDATGLITVENGSTTDAVFIPVIRLVQASNLGTFITGQAGSDSGTIACLSISGRIGTSTAPTVKPLFNVRSATTIVYSCGPKGKVAITPAASATAAAATAATLSAVVAADTLRTASAESVQFNFDGSASQQSSTGAVTTQRNALFKAPTYAFVGASIITNAATVAIDGPPVAGTNATITNPHSLWVQSGNTQLDGETTHGLRTNLKSYTVGTLPAVGVAGGMVYVSDAAVAACVAFSNGINWKRCDSAATTVT